MMTPNHATDSQIAELHGESIQGTVELTAARDPLDRIVGYMERGLTPEQLDKLLDLQHKWDAEQARRAYVRAMAAFKAEPIAAIKKQKRVKQRLRNKQTGEYSGAEINYKHETLGQVVKAAVSAMAKHGLSHSWDPSQDGQRVGVRCIVTHQEGHSESVVLYGPPDDSGQKNALQQVRSTITYLQRATLMLITGLAAEDGSDDDGRAAYQDDAPEQRPSGKATAAQLKLIRKKLGDRDESEFCKGIGVESLDALPFDRVNDCLAALDQK